MVCIIAKRDIVVLAMIRLALMHVLESGVNITSVCITMASERNNVTGCHHRSV
jgi:uncharacterized protein (UPF0179 family)